MPDKDNTKQLTVLAGVKRPAALDDLPTITAIIEEIAPQGEQTKLRDWVDHEIAVLDVRPFIGQYGAALYVVFADDKGALWNTIVGQELVARKLLTVRERLPVRATVRFVSGGVYEGYFDLE